MSRIENISDQLEPYSYQVYMAMKKLINDSRDDYKCGELDAPLSVNQALEILKITVDDMKNDVIHHFGGNGYEDGFNVKIVDPIEIENSQNYYTNINTKGKGKIVGGDD